MTLDQIKSKCDDLGMKLYQTDDDNWTLENVMLGKHTCTAYFKSTVSLIEWSTNFYLQ